MKKYLAATLLVTALSACGASPSMPTTQQPTTEGAAPSPAGPGPGAPATPVSTAKASVPASLGDPVGTRELVSEGNTYALDIFPLHRSGTTVRLDVRMRFVTMRSSEANQLLLSSNRSGHSNYGVPDVFELVDGPAGKLHQPARYEPNSVACSPQLPYRAATGDVAYVSCIFGAPSSDSVEVRAGRFGSFADVPIR